MGKLSIQASAGPPKAPPLGLGHSHCITKSKTTIQKMWAWKGRPCSRVRILGAAVLESQVLLSQRLKDYQVPNFLPQLHTMQNMCRCREMMYGCWKSRHQTEDSSYVTEKGVSKCVQWIGTLILKVVYMLLFFCWVKSIKSENRSDMYRCGQFFLYSPISCQFSQ